MCSPEDKNNDKRQEFGQMLIEHQVRLRLRQDQLPAERRQLCFPGLLLEYPDERRFQNNSSSIQLHCLTLHIRRRRFWQDKAQKPKPLLLLSRRALRRKAVGLQGLVIWRSILVIS
jgi:hypothetical protein